MRKHIAAMATSLAMMGLATDICAQQIPRAEDFGAPWQPAQTAVFDIGAGLSQFRILVSIPDAPPPPEGYGIIYAIDAGWTFGTLRDTERMQASRFAESAVQPTVIVGIGWPTDTLIDFDRRGTDLVGPETYGPGRAATLAMIRDQLIPRIEGRLSIDPDHRMILGHSFGGVFALQARNAQPGLFSHVAAGSPSIWTDPEALEASAKADGPPVLITVGALETPEAALAAGQPADRVSRLRERDMVGRAQRMAAALNAPFMEIPGATHGASVTGFLVRAVSFLWQTPVN